MTHPLQQLHAQEGADLDGGEEAEPDLPPKSTAGAQEAGKDRGDDAQDDRWLEQPQPLVSGRLQDLCVNVPVGIDQVVRRDMADEQPDDSPAEDDRHRGAAHPPHGTADDPISWAGIWVLPGTDAPFNECVVMSSSSSSTDEPGTGLTGVWLEPFASTTVRTTLSP